MMHFAADNKHLVYTRASASKARIFAWHQDRLTWLDNRALLHTQELTIANGLASTAGGLLKEEDLDLS